MSESGNVMKLMMVPSLFQIRIDNGNNDYCDVTQKR